VPAIIEFVAEEGSQDAEAVKGKLREISPRDGIGEIFHPPGADFMSVDLDPAILVHRITKKVTLFPGDNDNEETVYRADLTYAYRAGGKVHLIQAPLLGIVNTNDDEFYLLTPESIQKLPSIGSRQYVSFGMAVNTRTPDLNEWQQDSETYCPFTPHQTACFYHYWIDFQRLYSVEEVRDLIYNSSGLVVLDGGYIDTIFPRP